MWREPLDAIAGGVLWVDDSVDVSAMLDELGDRWITEAVSVEASASKQWLIAQIGDALNFPDWAGSNLDALYDLLTDLSWLGDDQHVALVLDRTPEARAAAIDGWQQVVQVLLDAAAWWQTELRVFVAILR